MKPKEFNCLLKEFNTNPAAFDALYKYYCPRIVVRIHKHYGGEKMGVNVAREFFTRLLKANHQDYIEFPTIWVSDFCDRIIKEKYPSVAPIKEESRVQFEKIIYEEFYESISKLDPAVKQIVVMYVYEGYSHEEIAKTLSMELESVKEKYTYGRKQLQA